MIAALKGKGVPVLWVGLPAIRGTRSTSDMSYLDELYRARAEKAGIPYVDIWDGFVDESGRYAVQGPDFEGQIRRLRTGDGVHFTKAGAVKLAHYVEHDLRRVLSSHIVPVALPGPEEQAPKGSAVGARPAIGPVVPWLRSAAARAAICWAPRAIRCRRHPIRSRRACSAAATPLRRRRAAPTISPGRAPAPMPRRMRQPSRPSRRRPCHRPKAPAARTIKQERREQKQRQQDRRQEIGRRQGSAGGAAGRCGRSARKTAPCARRPRRRAAAADADRSEPGLGSRGKHFVTRWLALRG